MSVAAGSASVSFVVGDGFDSIPGAPTFYSPGHNIQINELSLDNTLQRLRTPDNAEAVDSIAGNFEGAFTASWSVSATTESNVRDMLFNNSNTGFQTGLAQTSRWYVESNYLDTAFASNTVEAELRTVLPLTFQRQYQVGTNTIRDTLTAAYGDMRKNTTTTPSAITGPATGSDAPFYGTTLTVDSTDVSREQTITLDIQGPIYRYHRESSRTPSSAVLANPQVSLTSGVIYYQDDFLGLGLGSAAATQPQDSLNNVAGSLAYDQQDGTNISTWTLPRMKVAQWQGADIVNPDADFVGTATWNVDGGLSVA